MGLEFVLASMNSDKARELETLLAPAGMRLRPLAEFPGAQSPPETGETLLENARIKARYGCELTGMPAIADDTGLEVDALDGAPGAEAARFAGPGASYADNWALLLSRLEGVHQSLRTARFRCVIVARWPDGREEVAEGVLEGRITLGPRGHGGFGYDPVFEVLGTGRTLAELSPQEKNELSHRARAAQAMVERLKSEPRTGV